MGNLKQVLVEQEMEKIREDCYYFDSETKRLVVNPKVGEKYIVVPLVSGG